MFIDSKPTSLFSGGSHSSRSSFTEMEDTKPQLRRPPAALNHSSSSLSSNGFERSAPSFQSFIRKTPTPNQEKPLPPIPIIGTSEAFPISTRRTSSIYSRTVSQYAPTPESWRDEEHLMPTFFLQPSVYSLSTPELALGDTPQSIVPPRPCAPLLARTASASFTPDVTCSNPTYQDRVVRQSKGRFAFAWSTATPSRRDEGVGCGQEGGPTTHSTRE
jgi:hypothetical protein